MPKVSAEIIQWARETAGFSIETAAKKLGLKDSRDISAEKKLRQLESGGEEPSRALLVKMAKHYRRPLLTFYMSQPPRRGDRGEDFRTLPHGKVETEEALLDALIRNIKARQGMLRSLIEDEDDFIPVSFVGSGKITDGIEGIAAAIKETIGFHLEDFSKKPSLSAAFTYLRGLVEDAGVFVLLIGNLGSHHTTIDVTTFRGFALSDDIAPFIVINDQDAQAAWSFTLLHELTHLWLGQTGVSGARAEQKIERFCNDVAGEVLLPIEELSGLTIANHEDFESVVKIVTEFAAVRKLSSSMVSYRLYREKIIDETTWRELSCFYRQSWLKNRNAARKVAKEKGRKGPTYYTVRKHRIGNTLISYVGQMMASGLVTTTKAGKILGVKPSNVHHLIEGSQPI